jgi:hypothetical protein
MTITRLHPRQSPCSAASSFPASPRRSRSKGPLGHLAQSIVWTVVIGCSTVPQLLPDSGPSIDAGADVAAFTPAAHTLRELAGVAYDAVRTSDGAADRI